MSIFTSCREGFFSETGLPTLPILGKLGFRHTKFSESSVSGIQNCRKPGGFSATTRVDKGLPKGTNLFLNCSERLLYVKLLD